MKKKTVPVLFKKKEDCCGCTACVCICPQNAIKMFTDDEGFEYPTISGDKCVGCLSCIKVCPIKMLKSKNK